MKKILAFTALLTLLAVPAASQTIIDTQASANASANIDTVILASTANYPDALVASSAASKIGVPILLTEKDELPDEVGQSLSEFAPSNVILVGGPAVISDQVRSTLAQEYNVTRLWGATRYGTAVQVAEYFWPEGSDSAILVENSFSDDRGELLSVAKELAQEQDDPIFLTPNRKIPVSVMGQLEDMGVSSITYVGTPIAERVQSQLDGLGITVEERFVGEDENQVKQQLRQRLLTQMNASQHLNIVAATNFHHSIAAVNSINANSYIVGNASQIPEAVNAVRQRNISKVRVVGNPNLARNIGRALRNQTDAEVTIVGIQAQAAARFAANFTEDETTAYRKAHGRLMDAWQERIQQRSQALQERANHTLMRAERLVENANMSDDLGDELQKARVLYSNGQYLESLRVSHEVIAEVKEERWNRIQGNRTAIREEVREELSGLKDQIEELRELNQEFAEKMQQNMTVEERLEIIREFKDERREVVAELVKNATGLRSDEFRERLDDIKERFRDRDRAGGFRQEVELGCAEDISPGNARISFKGGDGYVRTEGLVGLNTPNYRPKMSVDVNRNSSTVSFTLSFSERGGFGVQCTGSAEFRARQEVAAGNWTVKTTVRVGSRTVASSSGMVAVTADDTDGEEREMENETRDDGDDLMAPTIDEAEARDGTAKVSATLNGSGYVVIHADDNGAPGAVVGHSPLVSGEFTTSVDFNASSGTTFWAMLHHDDGDGTYEFPDSDAPVTRDGSPIVSSFTNEQENDTSGDTEPAVEVVSDGSADTRVVMRNTAFQSSPTVDDGDVVRFVNNDSFGHTVTIEKYGIDVTVAGGESVTLQFNQKGTYHVVCTFHAGMETDVTVE